MSMHGSYSLDFSARRGNSRRSGPGTRHVSLSQRGKVTQRLHNVGRLDVDFLRSPDLVFVRNTSENAQRADIAVRGKRDVRQKVIFA